MTEKIRKQILSDLFDTNISNNEKAIRQIIEIKDEGFIAPLCKYYGSAQNNAIKSSIEDIFLNLRTENAKNEIISLLKNNHSGIEKQLLYNSCWQSALSFDNELNLFVDLIINETDFLIAFDLFTVIENKINLSLESSEVRKENLLKLKKKKEASQKDMASIYDKCIEVIADSL